MNNEKVTYTFCKKYVTGNWETTFISLKCNVFHDTTVRQRVNDVLNMTSLEYFAESCVNKKFSDQITKE